MISGSSLAAVSPKPTSQPVGPDVVDVAISAVASVSKTIAARKAASSARFWLLLERRSITSLTSSSSSSASQLFSSATRKRT